MDMYATALDTGGGGNGPAFQTLISAVTPGQQFDYGRLLVQNNGDGFLFITRPVKKGEYFVFGYNSSMYTSLDQQLFRQSFISIMAGTLSLSLAFSLSL